MEQWNQSRITNCNIFEKIQQTAKFKKKKRKNLKRRQTTNSAFYYEIVLYNQIDAYCIPIGLLLHFVKHPHHVAVHRQPMIYATQTINWKQR